MCYNSRAWDRHCDDMYEPEKPEEWEKLEIKLDEVTTEVKLLLSLLYSKDPINENDLVQTVGYLADLLDIALPDGEIQIARKSQALMDLQRYLLATRI